MGYKQENLIGKKFGRLTVEQLMPSRQYGKNKKRRWLSVCDCGKKTETDTGALTSGKTTSCGCYSAEVSADNGRKSRDAVRKLTASFNVMKGCYVRNAKTRGLSWELSNDDVKRLFNSNCFYCGLEPSNNYKNTYYNMKYSGIDRVNNAIGYTKDNTVSCCKICNHAKKTMSKEEFLSWIERVYKFQRIISDLEKL